MCFHDTTGGGVALAGTATDFVSAENIRLNLRSHFRQVNPLSNRVMGSHSGGPRLRRFILGPPVSNFKSSFNKMFFRDANTAEPEQIYVSLLTRE